MRDPNQRISVRPDGSIDVETVNNEPSMTQQQFKDECDINNIMAKYQQTGEFLHLTKKNGMYADFSQLTNYQDMLQQVADAQDAFASLPAPVRAKFQNDPGELINYLHDPKNREEATSLGLLNPKTTTALPNEPNQTNEPAQKNKTPKTDPT